MSDTTASITGQEIMHMDQVNLRMLDRTLNSQVDETGMKEKIIWKICEVKVNGQMLTVMYPEKA